MNRQKVYFYPSCPREGYVNPYCISFKENLKTYFDLLDADNQVTKMKSLTLLWYSFRADVFILNWIENVIKLRFGWMQYCLVLLSFLVIKFRKKKIIWIFHNMKPHDGENLFTNTIMSYLFKNSDLIISHSKEASDYAKKKTKCPVKYYCHPVKQIESNKWNGHIQHCDILIWGTILPYKGILEFLMNCSSKIKNEHILILGKCNDKKLASHINSFCSENIVFKNRKADFDELNFYIKSSKYVLFPYIGASVSSSGALIDTIAMGGVPIGPNKGAFKDLSDEGVCITYDNYEELLIKITSDSIIKESDKQKFIETNSWNYFITSLYKDIYEN